MEQTKRTIEHGTGLPLGAAVQNNRMVQFSIALPDIRECILHLYKKGDDRPFWSLNIGEKYKRGDIFSVAILLPEYENIEYTYEVNKRIILDPYACEIQGRNVWGKVYDTPGRNTVLRCAAPKKKRRREIEWTLRRPMEELVIYRLHVRGFTRHSSSKVTGKGTFFGLMQKIDYLVDLGINAVELMPCYEFNEIIPRAFQPLEHWKDQPDKTGKREQKPVKVNYWGYTGDACYFAPKLSYTYDQDDPCGEFERMVKLLHENGIEVYMEMFFTEGTRQSLIVDCLRYWVMRYGIDGFHINTDVAPALFLANDPILADIKLFANGWNTEEIYRERMKPAFRHLGEYHDGFLQDIRCYLKSDEEMVGKVAYRMRKNGDSQATVNYLANTNGFTLADLFSYDVKHNEANGEDNRDGTSYNHSWNCGVEGKTRKKTVLELRRREIKNALAILFFSQGIPLLLAGDEFGNSQEGNNNAYCQDNKISWLNWNQAVTNREQIDYVKRLIQERKEHKILHLGHEMKEMDYMSCGCPDISFHGTKAWYPDFSNYSRLLGVLLCGRYAADAKGNSDSDYFLAINMHWQEHTFDLPNLSDNRKWTVFLNTASDEEKKVVNMRRYDVQPRSIVILKSEKRISSRK